MRTHAVNTGSICTIDKSTKVIRKKRLIPYISAGPKYIRTRDTSSVTGTLNPCIVFFCKTADQDVGIEHRYRFLNRTQFFERPQLWSAS